MRTLASALVLTAALGLAAPASAHDAGDWLVRVGASAIDPKSDNGTLDLSAIGQGPQPIQVDDKTGVTFNVTYMYTKNIGVEILAALPFEHDVYVGTLGLVGTVEHLPPTVSVQYHFMPDSVFQPYAGIGLNYTGILSSKEKGALVTLGAWLDVDDSVGLAAQLGFDYEITDQWFLNFDLRYIDIDADATIGVPGVGTLKTTVNIDPVVYGIHLGYRF